MRRPIVIQLALFLVVSLVAVGYGVRFVLGPQSLGGSIHITAHMEDGLGLTDGTAVTYRGVSVGKISSVSVDPNGDGAALGIDLDPGTRIPVGSLAKTSTASALGIQALDISPTTARGPYLKDGGTLQAPGQDQPKQLSDLLVETSKLTASIDPNAISTLAETLGTGLDGAGPELQQLIGDADILSKMLQSRTPEIAGLVVDGLPLLRSLADNSPALPGTAKAVRNVSEQLVANEPSLVYLLDRSPAALTRVQSLLDSTRGDVGSLLTNMVTVTTVLGDRTPALGAGLVSIPAALSKLTSVVHGDRGDFTLVATQGPVCYYETARRIVGDVSPRDPNLALYCPPEKDLEQRGSQNAPRPNGLGLSNATTPGKVTGPPIAKDPILIPSGAETLDYWKKLLEGVLHGNP